MKLLSSFVLILIISSAFGLRRFKRLIGGSLAKKNTFPYMVGLRLYLVNEKFPTWCGGSIIDHEWILTAAHCTQSAESVDVIMGSAKISLASTIHSIDRSNIIVHPNWNQDNMTDDISLIKIPFTDYSADIQPITLPSDSSYESSKAVSAGWGQTSDKENIINDDLKWANFTIISMKECVDAYPTVVRSTNICVDTKHGHSTCGGDSGGPLVLQDSKVLVGVNSHTSAGGCSIGRPAVFVRVSSYMDWIKSYMGN